MQVRYKTTPNALIIYREKWGTLAMGLVLGMVCVAFGVVFYGLMTDNGLHTLVTNAQGITLSPNLGSEPRLYPWGDIEEIVLAEKLRIIDSDETSYLWRSVVIFLPMDALGSASWFKRAKSGINLSGVGRPFLLGDFPHGLGQTIQAALRRFSPSAVRFFTMNERCQ